MSFVRPACLLPVLLLSLAARPAIAAGDPAPAYRGSIALETDCFCPNYELPEFEPSGIVWSGPVAGGRGYLYAVSDNGQVARRPVDPPLEAVRWQCLYRWCQDPKDHAAEKAQNDFESVAYVPGADGKPGRLFIGVEGDAFEEGDPAESGKGANQKPQIRELNLETGQWGATWDLDLPVARGQGVEAMTYVPSPVAVNAIRGYFLASTTQGKGEDPNQKDSKLARLYDIAQAPQGGALTGIDVGPLASAKASDFYYSPRTGKLYAAYDDESAGLRCVNAKGDVIADCTGALPATTYVGIAPGRQKIQVYTWVAPTKLGTPEATYPMGRTRGLEGVTEVQGELYVSIDMAPKQNPGTLRQAPAQKRPTKDRPDKENREAVAQVRANLDTIDLYDLCPTHVSSCGEIKDTQCGWCLSEVPSGQAQAMLGSAEGPHLGTCRNWFWRTSDCGCAETTVCGNIKGDCGWCRAFGGQPMLGVKDGGPLFPSSCPNASWVWASKDC